MVLVLKNVGYSFWVQKEDMHKRKNADNTESSQVKREAVLLCFEQIYVFFQFFQTYFHPHMNINSYISWFY